MKDTELAYLAGLVDGEGSIGLSYQTAKPSWKNKSCNHVRPQVDVVANTNFELIRVVVKLLQGFSLSPRVVSYGTDKRNARWKAAWKVYLVTLDDKKKFLELIHPYLVGKKAQAEMVMEFLSRRSSHHKVKTTQYERLLAERCQQLNQRGRSSESVETERQTGDTLKFQSELHGDVQSSAEMTEPVN